MKDGTFQGMQYILSYPENFNEGEKHPLLFFMHGAGTRGTQLSNLKGNAFLVEYAKHGSLPFIVAAPLCSENTWFDMMETLKAWIKETAALPYVDASRVYLMGNSMGGYGTWALASLHPNWFASAMPVCGGGIGGFAMNLVNLPIRAFHGLRDETVDPIESLQMAKAVNMYGGHAELILFPELAHNCWNAVYSDEKNYDWLLSFTAQPDKPLVEDLSSTYYG